MEYKITNKGTTVLIEGRKNESADYIAYAVINEDSRLIFYGDFSEEKCEEIVSFLSSQGIYIDDVYAYKLTNWNEEKQVGKLSVFSNVFVSNIVTLNRLTNWKNYIIIYATQNMVLLFLLLSCFSLIFLQSKCRTKNI